jgi:hypothetical protein
VLQQEALRVTERGVQRVVVAELEQGRVLVAVGHGLTPP